jgi:transposase
MKHKKVPVEELLSLIPDELLDQLSQETKVDYQVKKLTGKLIFKLFLYALSSQKELSWRLLEEIFGHYKFQQFTSLSPEMTTDHSSLATRISNIEVSYFSSIYESLSQEVKLRFPTDKIGGYKLIRFDSTLVSIAGSLLKQINGLHHGVNKGYKKPSDPVNIKFSVGYDGLQPVCAKLFAEQKYLSENAALKEALETYQFKADEMAVFDRGINSRASFDEFTDQELNFVTRLKTQKGVIRHVFVKTVTDIKPEMPLETETLWIEKDQLVYLFGKESTKTNHPYRIIFATDKQKQKTYIFLSNNLELSPQEITEIYKRRWDIEVFFKFLKQEFGFKHLLSRSQNGIEVILYMTLITFTLIYLYYKLNKVHSFKIAKIRFTNEIEFEVMKVIIEICQGNPSLLNRFAPP